MAQRNFLDDVHCDFCNSAGVLSEAMCVHEHRVGVMVCERHRADLGRGWIDCRVCDRDVPYPHKHACPLSELARAS